MPRGATSCDAGVSRDVVTEGSLDESRDVLPSFLDVREAASSILSRRVAAGCCSAERSLTSSTDGPGVLDSLVVDGTGSTAISVVDVAERSELRGLESCVFEKLKALVLLSLPVDDILGLGVFVLVGESLDFIELSTSLM